HVPWVRTGRGHGGSLDPAVPSVSSAVAPLDVAPDRGAGRAASPQEEHGMDVSLDERTLEVWVSSELEAAAARLRAWRRRRLGGEPALHRDGNFVDPAQQTMVTETRSADAARLADRVRCLARAFDRLRDGRYGRCEKCDEAIGPSRLRAIPLAELCLACQRAWELSLVYRGEEAGHRRRPGGRSPRAKRPVRPDRRSLALAG